MLDRILARLRQEQMPHVSTDALSLDSTVIKVHPDGTGALKTVGKSCGGWTTKLHLAAASAECAVIFSLSPGQAGDAPEGRKLLTVLGKASESCAMIMDRAYEGDETRKFISDHGFSPVAPPKSNRTEPWEYDKELHKKRNEVERLFRRLKGFRRIFTRFDKLDVMFLGFVVFALIAVAIK